jgi:hypothetical protein
MKKVLLFTLITVFLASCSGDPTFELKVNIKNNNSLKDMKLVVMQQIDGKVVYFDSIKINKDNFLLKIPYKGQGLLNISIPQSNVKDIMMAAEEGIIRLNIEGTKTHFGGAPLNDRLQAFYQGNDSISSLFQQISKENESLANINPDTPQMRKEFIEKSEELRLRRSQLITENTNRIIAFIKENVDNPVGEYYFMTHYTTFPVDLKLELNSFATEKLKSVFGLR